MEDIHVYHIILKSVSFEASLTGGLFFKHQPHLADAWPLGIHFDLANLGF